MTQVEIELPQDIRAVDAAARQAEQRGETVCWVRGEDPAALLRCHAAVFATRRLGVACLAPALATTPMALAYAAWDVATGAEGRFILGLGPGHGLEPHDPSLGAYGSGTATERMIDFVAALRAILSAWQDGRPVDVAGIHYRHESSSRAFAPGPGTVDLPIWLAPATRAEVVDMARLADGVVLPTAISGTYLDEELGPALVEVPRGRRVGWALLVVGNDEESRRAERERAQDWLRWFVGRPWSRALLAHLGYDHLADELLARPRGRQEPNALLEALYDELAVEGTSRVVFDEVTRRYGDHLDRVVSVLPTR